MKINTQKNIDKVSIITVTYNSSKFIEKYLLSAIKNKSQINEIIIIENNSPDKITTKKICIKYSSQIPVKFYLNKNVGFGRSCNKGSKLANSNYLLFLNPDTELQKNSIKTLIDHIKLNKADIIGGKATDYNSIVHGSVVRIPNALVGLFEFSNLGKLFKINAGHEHFYYKDKNILNVNTDTIVDCVSGAYFLITKNNFFKLNGFDENTFMYLEDVDLCKRANDERMKVMYCPHSKIWHIGGASSKNKYHIHHQAWFDSRKYYYKKHFSIFTNLLIQPVFWLDELVLKLIKHL